MSFREALVWQYSGMLMRRGTRGQFSNLAIMQSMSFGQVDFFVELTGKQLLQLETAVAGLFVAFKNGRIGSQTRGGFFATAGDLSQGLLRFSAGELFKITGDAIGARPLGELRVVS